MWSTHAEPRRSYVGKFILSRFYLHLKGRTQYYVNDELLLLKMSLPIHLKAMYLVLFILCLDFCSSRTLYFSVIVLLCLVFILLRWGRVKNCVDSVLLFCCIIDVYAIDCFIAFLFCINIFFTPSPNDIGHCRLTL